MAYEPKTWRCGDVITDTDLNRMEQGIASASSGDSESDILTVTFTTRDFSTVTADKTYAEVAEAVNNGKYVVARLDTGFNMLMLVPTEFTSNAARFMTFTPAGSSETHVSTSVTFITCLVRSDGTAGLETMWGAFVETNT